MAPPPSHSQSALPGRNSLVLDSISEEQSRFVLNVRTDNVPRCPECRRSSSSYHSKYIRTVHDLPWQGREVKLRLILRRFRCRNVRCVRKVFAERVPDVVRRYARRTDRLHEIVRAVGYAAGGLPGAFGNYTWDLPQSWCKRSWRTAHLHSAERLIRQDTRS